MQSKTILLKLIFFLVCFTFFSADLPTVAEVQHSPSILPLKDQASVYDSWLRKRLDTILPEVMRRENIDMWLVICEEYNEDPVYLSLVPFTSFSARRLSILVFYDRRDGGLEKFSVGRYGIGDLYKTIWDPAKENQWQALARAVKERNPKRIGINESLIFSFGNGLTSGLKQQLVQALGKEFASKLVSADKLAIGWLERRLPEEIGVYHHIVKIAHAIIAEAFSPAVITPGITTTLDVEWWMWEKARRLGLNIWFKPSVSIQRPRHNPYGSSNIIQRGDLLHCDFGIMYLRLATDTQEMAYVLREGELDAPAGLKKALALGNRLQDIHLSVMKQGLTGNQILAAALEQAKKEGIMASIYSHPLGFHGHGAGPVIGLWDMQDGVPGKGDYPLYPDTVYSIELNIRTPVAEWDNQEIRIALEQNAAFTNQGIFYLNKRQTEFHLIK